MICDLLLCNESCVQSQEPVVFTTNSVLETQGALFLMRTSKIEVQAGCSYFFPKF